MKYGKYILGILAIPVWLFGYGFTNGVIDVNSGDHNLLTLGLKASSMDIVSLEGYRLGLRTNPDFVERIDSF